MELNKALIVKPPHWERYEADPERRAPDALDVEGYTAVYYDNPEAEPGQVRHISMTVMRFDGTGPYGYKVRVAVPNGDGTYRGLYPYDDNGGSTPTLAGAKAAASHYAKRTFIAICNDAPPPLTRSARSSGA